MTRVCWCCMLHEMDCGWCGYSTPAFRFALSSHDHTFTKENLSAYQRANSPAPKLGILLKVR